MTTQRDAFDERLSRLEGEVGDIKTLLGENAVVQSRILNLLDQQGQQLGRLDQRIDRVEQRLDRVDRRTEDIARHLDVPSV